MTRTELLLPDPPGKVKPVKRLIRSTGHLLSHVSASRSHSTREMSLIPTVPELARQLVETLAL